MKRKYDEIMEHIEVTPEIRQRVLRRIREEHISPPAHKDLPVPKLKKYLAAAACFVLLLAGTAILPQILDRGEQNPPPLAAGYGIEEAASLQELAELTGFAITEEFQLPFTPAETAYASYWRELAQIEYSGEGQSAVFRKSMGTEDNSGDFSSYDHSAELILDGHSVLLKGNDGAYSLAIWTDGEYAYSLRLSQTVTEEEWSRILLP